MCSYRDQLLKTLGIFKLAEHSNCMDSKGKKLQNIFIKQVFNNNVIMLKDILLNKHMCNSV